MIRYKDGASVLCAICWLGLLTYFCAFLSNRMWFSTGQIELVDMLAGGGESGVCSACPRRRPALMSVDELISGNPISASS